MDLSHLVAILRRYIRALIVAATLGAVAGYVASLTLPRVYEAETKLLVGQLLQNSNPSLTALDTSSRLSTTYATLAETRPLLEKVIAQLGLEMTPEELERRIQVDATIESPYVTISAEAPDAARAAAIANALAQHLIDSSPGLGGTTGVDEFFRDQIQATREDIEAAEAEIATITGVASPPPDARARLAVLEDRLTGLRATYASLLEYLFVASPNVLSIVEPAVAPLEPASPKPLINLVLVAILATLLTATLALAWEQLDDTVKSGREVEHLLGISPLAMIPRMPGRQRDALYRLVTVITPLSSSAEAFRSLRTNLAFSSVDEPVRSIVVTSGTIDEGKTTVATNLAVVLAQAGNKVILVDADLRRPTVHDVFRMEQDTGLSTMLNFPEMSVDRVARPTEVPGLRVIPSGIRPPNPVELMASQRMRTVTAALESACDIVIFDTPPIGPVSDAAILATLADGVLIVAASRKTRSATLRHAHEALVRAGARILGVVLNVVGSESVAYYGYAASDDEDGSGGGKPRTAPSVTAIDGAEPVGKR